MNGIGESIKWIFDGIGTAIVSSIIGLVVGGFIGYCVCIRVSSKQKQRAGDNSNQEQIVTINDSTIINNKKNTIRETRSSQIQNAGDNSDQIQIGELNNNGQ